VPRSPKALNRSLGLRLLLFAGTAIGAALIAAWAVLGLLFERHSERQLRAELERHGVAVIAALQLDAGGRPAILRQPTDPRFQRPASGLYWRVAAPRGELRSRSLWDGALPAVASTGGQGWVAANGKGPYERRVVVVARQVKLGPNDPRVLVEVAADRQPVSEARTAFGKESALFLGVLWLALALAAWIQVRMGLKPLARVRADLDAMFRSVDARLDAAEHPVEIRPLSEAINAVAERRADDIVRARHRARDLAHALKTPLTALRLQVEALPPETASRMMQGLSLVSGAVESELAQTGAGNSGENVDARVAVERLLTVIARTPDGARICWRNDVPASLLLPMETSAALEALGAIIENAARHAASTVDIAGGADGNARWIEICDDGPGIPASLRAAALDRGVRLDERGGSQGLGLSIARDIVEASGGSLLLKDGRMGGLCLQMTWPALTHPPSRDRPAP
jgi:signal transduction histidine kinase